MKRCVCGGGVGVQQVLKSNKQAQQRARRRTVRGAKSSAQMCELETGR